MADGEFVWRICPGIGDSAGYSIRLHSLQCAQVWESEPFALIGSGPAPTLSWSRPAGGETFLAGTTETITWEATDPFDLLTIGLMRDISTVSLLDFAPMSDGSYGWSIDPQLPTLGTYQLVGMSLECGRIYVLSRPFTIVDRNAGDIDNDSDVDGEDYRRLQECLGGPDVLVGDECADADINRDGAVDLRDVMLAFRFTTPGL